MEFIITSDTNVIVRGIVAQIIDHLRWRFGWFITMWFLWCYGMKSLCESRSAAATSVGISLKGERHCDMLCAKSIIVVFTSLDHD